MPVTSGIDVRGPQSFAAGDIISLNVNTVSGEPNRVRYKIMQMELLSDPTAFGYMLRGYAAPVQNADMERVQFAFHVDYRDQLRDRGFARHLADSICQELKSHLLRAYGYHADILPQGDA